MNRSEKYKAKQKADSANEPRRRKKKRAVNRMLKRHRRVERAKKRATAVEGE